MFGRAEHVAQVVLQAGVGQHIGVNGIVARPVGGIGAYFVATRHLIRIDGLWALFDIAHNAIERVLVIRVDLYLQFAGVGSGDNLFPGGYAG